MRDFTCPNCGQQLAFENSVCLSCSSPLGFSLALRTLLVIADFVPTGDNGNLSGEVDGRRYRLCDNLHVAKCNWLVQIPTEPAGQSVSDGGNGAQFDPNPSGSAPEQGRLTRAQRLRARFRGSTTRQEVIEPAPPAVYGTGPALCESCRLTRTRPNDADIAGLDAFAEAEAAKRRLIVELAELGLPLVGRDENPNTGLAFDLLSSKIDKVFTGHQNGVITLDLAEADDPHREQLRIEMAEPYRTLLGHFRHEIGHYYFTVLVADDQARQRFLNLFGDPDADYQAAIDHHYSHGAPAGWESNFVSSYATMHAAEDWAETFAHYLHIRDTLDTAAAFGIASAGATLDRPQPGPAGFDKIIDQWLPLAWSLNMVNRSMGHPDLYPFVLPEPVLEKMRLVHELCATAAV
ncbi:MULTISPECIES: zinc-binding metallopeptidase family protein [Nocardia]|uniref:zinc-binding metallopeptidase family protein n=1 Tax=Nocardia TaxID=1817 RepID=UPI001E5D1129|nr:MULTISPECIES: putative zinc-binding metallopeptidase [Nocardia]